MTTKTENSLIHKVYLVLEQIKKGTIKEISATCDLTPQQVTNAVDRLLELNKAHVKEWNHTETSRCPVRVITLGRGVNAPRERKSDITERDEIAIDTKLKQAEHRRFMANFKPHPDIAAGWMFERLS
jgi:hypothetical protein